MNLFTKTLAIATVAIGLSACAAKAPAPTPTVPNKAMTTMPAPAKPITVMPKKNSMKECMKVKKQLRKLDRSTPNAQVKVSALEKELDELNCGVK